MESARKKIEKNSKFIQCNQCLFRYPEKCTDIPNTAFEYFISSTSAKGTSKSCEVDPETENESSIPFMQVKPMTSKINKNIELFIDKRIQQLKTELKAEV